METASAGTLLLRTAMEPLQLVHCCEHKCLQTLRFS